MKLKFIILLIPAFIFGCKTENAKEQIGQLQKELATNASPEKMSQLMESYKSALSKGEADVNQIANYSYELAQLQIKQNKFKDAASTLQNALKNGFDGASTDKNIPLLASLYVNQLRSPETIDKHIADFRGYFPDSDATKTKLTQLIESTKANIYNEQSHRIDPAIASSYVSLCEWYGFLFANDPVAPSYLFQAGETARSIRNFRKALDIYDRILLHFKSFDKTPQALFLKAFTLDNDLKQYDKAKQFYESFLTQYPKDEFADDTQFLLENLGKSDDEIIKKFEK